MRVKVVSSTSPEDFEDRINKIMASYKVTQVSIIPHETSGVIPVPFEYEALVVYEDAEELIEIGRLRQENKELEEAIGNIRRINEELDEKIRRMSK